MGFSASQARYLALTARMSDMEFQGQQINQQRTSLANASSQEYSKLQDMVVPTPPSIMDFKKIEYSFMYGTTPTTLGAIRPDGDRYTVEFLQQRVGNYMADSTSNILVRNTGTEGSPIYNVSYEGDTRQLNTLRSQLDYMHEPDDEHPEPYLVHGAITPGELQGYIEGFRNAHPEYAEAEDDDIIDMLMVYFEKVDRQYEDQPLFDPETGDPVYATDPDGNILYDDDENPIQATQSVLVSETPRHNSPIHFIMASDLGTLSPNSEYSWMPQYECIANGEYTHSVMMEGCSLTFDPSSGRVLSIEVPNASNDGTRSYSLESAEVTDNDAYNDAFNQYEFQKYQYDKKQQDINNTMKTIEEQDKKLQLKLTRLDNERNAVNKELDSVKKVIQDNTDKSFGAFSG